MVAILEAIPSPADTQFEASIEHARRERSNQLQSEANRRRILGEKTRILLERFAPERAKPLLTALPKKNVPVDREEFTQILDGTSRILRIRPSTEQVDSELTLAQIKGKPDSDPAKVVLSARYSPTEGWSLTGIQYYKKAISSVLDYGGHGLIAQELAMQQTYDAFGLKEPELQQAEQPASSSQPTNIIYKDKDITNFLEGFNAAHHENGDVQKKANEAMLLARLKPKAPWDSTQPIQSDLSPELSSWQSPALDKI